MHKFLFILTLLLFCLIAQVLCLRIFGEGFVPNFVLIGMIFVNLYRGLRMGLGAAFLGGFLLDSYSGSVWGVHTATFVICAFLTGTLKMYLYQPGVAESRVMMVFVITVAYGLLQYVVNFMVGVDLRFAEAFGRAILPEVVLTTVVANITLERLRACALKLFAS